MSTGRATSKRAAPDIRPRNRQEAPPVYQMVGLDTFNVEKFLKYQKIILPRMLPYEIQPETGIMIDTELEFKIVEIMMKNKLIKNTLNY